MKDLFLYKMNRQITPCALCELGCCGVDTTSSHETLRGACLECSRSFRIVLQMNGGTMKSNL